MNKTVEFVLPYTPRPLQKYVSDNLKRYNVLVMHRRFGKSYMLVYEILRRAFTFDAKDPLTNKPLKNPKYFFISPEKAQTKRNVWDYFKEALYGYPGVHFNNAELIITFPLDSSKGTATIYCEGADKPDRLRGVYIDGVVLDEYSQMPPAMWEEVVSPAATDRKGWVIFSGTPKGRNKFYKLYVENQDEEDWFTACFKASETGYLDEKYLAEKRRSMTHAAYMQEYECSFDAALKGSYFEEAFNHLDANNRINSDVVYNPDKTVYTAWDIGLLDDTVIWFIQPDEDHFKVIDVYISNDKILSHYIDIINRKPYHYGGHLLPHDGAQRSKTDKKTVIQYLRENGLNNVIKVPKPKHKIDSINAAISVLYDCRFNSIKCADGINGLRLYRAKYNELLEVFSDEPEKGPERHIADAFQTFALGKSKIGKRTQPAMRQPQIVDYDPLTETITTR